MAKLNTVNVPKEQVTRELNRTLKSADPMRADSLFKLQNVRSAKSKNQEREKVRLTKKLGSEHRRVKVLEAKINSNQMVTRNLKLEFLRACTEVTTVRKEDWLVHGRVMNKKRQPLRGLKAALFDESSCPIATCGSEITDKTGYLSLTIKNVPRDTPTQAEVKKETPAGSGDQFAQDDSAVGFLYVMDRKDVVLHRDKRPLSIAPGQAQYLEILIDDKDVDEPKKS